METILRTDALKLIFSGQYFDLCWVTADRKRGTGGAYMEVKNWKIASAAKDRITPKNPTLAKPASHEADAAHRENKTFNICNPRFPSQRLYKVHTKLFTRINNKLVVQ